MNTAGAGIEIKAGDDLSALAWVSGELRRSLEGAHKSLRRYLKEAEGAAGSDVDAVDRAVLRAARAQLHQGVGALELVGLPAAADVLRASEAAVQRLLGELWADDPAIVVPAIVPERCAPMVLTQAFAEGRNFYDFVEHADQEARNRAGRHLFRFAFRNVFHHAQLPGIAARIGADGARVAGIDIAALRALRQSRLDAFQCAEQRQHRALPPLHQVQHRAPRRTRS